MMSRVLCVVALLVVVCHLTKAEDLPPPPPFLQGASPALIDEFHKLLATSSAKTDKQIDDAVDDWVSKQDDGIKSKYAEFKTQMKEHHSVADAAHKAAVEKFSPEAKAADEKLSEIATHVGLTAEQKHKEIEKVVNSLSPTVRAEIEKAMSG